MSEKAKSVSIAAGRNYIDAMKIVALRRKKRVADIVREALDSSYGDEIERVIAESASFFADNDTHMYQSFAKEAEVQK